MSDEEATEETFEESLKALEKIVRDLEGGGLPLDEAIKAYERAALYRDRCRKILDEADRRVQKLIEAADGARKEDFLTE
ncbi:MAG: exodeoxyribonuclease VII small subunit [Candidatus Methanoplasma sp.]|jgi:exodeoxyribonuclease VII small subunit|nr:exodeoxyribonuclease VII small subunit [Candidatus Methanoplasma sp.]